MLLTLFRTVSRLFDCALSFLWVPIWQFWCGLEPGQPAVTNPPAPTAPVRHRPERAPSPFNVGSRINCGRGAARKSLRTKSLPPVAFHRIIRAQRAPLTSSTLILIPSSIAIPTDRDRPIDRPIARPDRLRAHPLPSHARRTCSTAKWGSVEKHQTAAASLSLAPSPHQRGTRSLCALRSGDALASPQLFTGEAELRRFGNISARGLCSRFCSLQPNRRCTSTKQIRRACAVIQCSE